jgi:hypothetical protein
VAVNDQQFADVLNGSCAQFAADLFVVSDPVIATVAINTNLDQLVGLEAVVDFLENRLGGRFRQSRRPGHEPGRAVRDAGQNLVQHIKPFKNGILPNEENQNQQGLDDGARNDPYVQLAKKEGWRSRAAFKLMEIDDKDKLLKRGEVVVDLGATPGGWSQVVKRVGDGGLVFALDLLEMEPIHGVYFIQGDFREDDVLQQLEEKLGDRRVGLVMSDMAPNMSGVPLGRSGARHASRGVGLGVFEHA